MSTRSIVPNAAGEGSLGTTEKPWGGMYVSTPADGSNDAQVPSTAWVQKLVAQAVAEATKQAKLDAHPVGSYYFSDDPTDPGTLFGGTWEALPAGYGLIAQGKGTDSFGDFEYKAGEKYGERMHQLTVEEMPSHGHMVRSWNAVQTGYNPKVSRTAAGSENGPSEYFHPSGKWSADTGGNAPQGGIGDPCGTTDLTGFNHVHNNTPCVVATHCWKRTK